MTPPRNWPFPTYKGQPIKKPRTPRRKRTTPAGPWFVSDEGSFKVATLSKKIGVYADVFPGPLTLVADARLIAAAPDLLEALQNLENDDGAIPDHAWALVQAAIAKATGEQP